MRNLILLVTFLGLATTASTQDFGTALLGDARFDQVINKSVKDIASSIVIEPITSDSVKKKYYPYKVYGSIQRGRLLYFGNGAFPVKESIVCIDRNNNVSAILFFVQGNADSLYAFMHRVYGQPSSRMYLNLDEAFGVKGKPVTYGWNIKDYNVALFVDGYSGQHTVLLHNANREDYIH